MRFSFCSSQYYWLVQVLIKHLLPFEFQLQQAVLSASMAVITLVLFATDFLFLFFVLLVTPNIV